MIQKVFKNGNSLAVTIPADFAKMLGVVSGQDVEAVGSPTESKLTLIFKSTSQMPLLAEK